MTSVPSGTVCVSRIRELRNLPGILQQRAGKKLDWVSVLWIVHLPLSASLPKHTGGVCVCVFRVVF